jgi:NADPH2:quinone reductase
VSTLVPVPDELGDHKAAALLHDGPTALTLLDLAQVRPGERVLVTAAASGMGTLLVQWLHAAGATVIAAANRVASSPGRTRTGCAGSG